MSTTRFLSDAKGSYDLQSVSAITMGGPVRKVKDGPTFTNAILVFDGGNAVASDTAYSEAVAAWKAHLEPAPTEPAEPAK